MPTPEEIKAEIMAKVEKLVDEALASGTKPLTMTQIEDLVLGVGGKLETELTKEMVKQQARQLNAEIATCAGCGKRMHRKGEKRRYLRSRSGEMEVERAYFYCQACQTGRFPPR